MEKKTFILNKQEINLIIGGLILLGNDYADRLEEAKNDEKKVPCFSCDLAGKSLPEFMCESQLEFIRDLWDKLDSETT